MRDVLEARPVATPVTEPMIARPADAAVVVVLGGGRGRVATARKPGPPRRHRLVLGQLDPGAPRPRACPRGPPGRPRWPTRRPAIDDPRGTFDAVYVSDLFAHRQWMHLDAMGLAGECPERVNPDGGSLAGGDLFEATGGARLFDAVRQLRGEAGAHQVPGARTRGGPGVARASHRLLRRGRARGGREGVMTVRSTGDGWP